MTDEEKIAEQLIREFVEMRQRISELEQFKVHHNRAEMALQKSEGKYIQSFDEAPVCLARMLGDLTGRKLAAALLDRAEERYRSIFNNAVEGIFQSTWDGRFIVANPACARILGYASPEELIVQDSAGHRPYFVDPERYKEFQRLLEENGLVKGYKAEVYRKDGGKIWISANALAVRDASGAVVFYEGTMEDITEEKFAEERLRESEERYRLLVENAPLGIISMGRQGQIVDVNPILLSILGLPSKQATKSINIFTFPPLVENGIAGNIRRCMESGEPGIYETPFINKWGKEVYLRYNVTPMQEVDNQITGVQAIVEDISEKKKLEVQLIHAQKMEAIGTLAGGIAHDFNNILAVIVGYAELVILEVPPGSKAERNLKEVLKASHRARDLVHQILTFSRQSRQEPKPLEIGPIIKETLKLLRASLPSSIEIRDEIENDIGRIEADPTQICQVLMSLCTNAAHAMSENGGVLEVSLSNVDTDASTAAQDSNILPGPYIRLSVSDTGHGMCPEVLERIFDPYFTTKEAGKGPGLGLAMVHGIVKSHQGAITVNSKLGKGTTFHVYFPKIDNPKGVADTQEVEPLLMGGNERILFIDDEQALVDIGEQLLKHMGYKVTVKTSSIEALELFRTYPERFDLVITDMTMPNMTGDKLSRELMSIRPDIPIILCTGFSEYITEEKVKEMGIRELAMKPLVMNDLAQTIRRALDQKKRRV